MIIRTARKKNFTVIDNRILEDDRLSFKAKGILCYLLSRPDDWQVNDAHLSTIGIDGEASTRSALKEIEDAGYLVRIRHKGQRGRFEWTTYVFDEPQPRDGFPPMETPPMVTPVDDPQDGFPPVDRPPMENPRVDNRTVINTIETKTEKQPLLPPEEPADGNDVDAGKKKQRGAVHKCWQENMPGMMTPIIADELNELIDSYGPTSVIHAVGVAVKADIRNMRYVAGILQRENARASPSGNGHHDGKPLSVERMEGEDW